MAETKITIFLDNNDLMLLERIIIDKDKEEALRFAEMLKKKVAEKQPPHCKPPL